MPISDNEAAFDHWYRILCKEMPLPENEYQFASPRKWRFDRAWPDMKVAVEVHGYGHNQANHFDADIEKLNTAVFLGWRVLVFTSMDLKKNPEALFTILRGVLRPYRKAETEGCRTRHDTNKS